LAIGVAIMIAAPFSKQLILRKDNDMKKQFIESNDPKKREFENKVIKFFTDKIPEIEDFLKLTYSDCANNESVGLNMVMADIDRYFTNCVKKQRFDKAKEYLSVYWNFYQTFEKEYHTIEKSDTMQNLTRVELFETIDCFDEETQKKVVEFLPKELKADYLLCSNP
jgi:hypothetical protein